MCVVLVMLGNTVLVDTPYRQNLRHMQSALMLTVYALRIFRFFSKSGPHAAFSTKDKEDMLDEMDGDAKLR